MTNAPTQSPPECAPSVIGLREASNRSGLSIRFLVGLIEQGLIAAVQSNGHTLLHEDEVRAVSLDPSDLMSLVEQRLARRSTKPTSTGQQSAGVDRHGFKGKR